MFFSWISYTELTFCQQIEGALFILYGLIRLEITTSKKNKGYYSVIRQVLRIT